jgi:hypothetical protein
MQLRTEELKNHELTQAGKRCGEKKGIEMSKHFVFHGEKSVAIDC